MLDRIKQIIDYSNLNNSSFADKIGMNKSTLSHVLSGRNNPSLDLILNIIESFPEINPEWLLTGNKTMFNNGEDYNPDISNNTSNNNTISNKNSITLFDDFDNNNLEINKKESLVKQDYSYSSNSEENLIEKDESSPIINDKNTNNLKDIEPQENKTKSVEKTSNNKSIKRVILIYSDNTFEDFIK